MKERSVRVLHRVVAQALDGVVCDGGGGVVAAFVGRRSHGLIVDAVALGGKVVALFVQVERTVEPAIKYPAVDVPLPAVVATIAGGFEEVRQQAGPRLASTGASANAGQGVALDLLRIIAGEQRAARRNRDGELRFHHRSSRGPNIPDRRRG